jgi:hypothetical protein
VRPEYITVEHVDTLKRGAMNGDWRSLESIAENAITGNDDMPSIIVEKFGPVVMSGVLDAAIDGIEKIPPMSGGNIFNYLQYFDKMMSLLIPAGMVRPEHVERMVVMSKTAPPVVRCNVEWIVEKCKQCTVP